MSNRPMRDMLERMQGTIRFHTPGHKGIRDLWDVTELPRTDDLFSPYGAIAQMEKLAAAACGAAHSVALTGGSTTALHAVLGGLLSPGDTLLCPRDVHFSVLSAGALLGLDVQFGDDMLALIHKTPHARAILVTRPDYFGRCIDLAPLVKAAHQHGMLIVVDEAHGAYFPYWESPQSAAFLGADAWVQSAHKTLPALTGAAWIHLRYTVDADRVRRSLRVFHSSSPHFSVLQSLDESRAFMQEEGRAPLATLVKNALAFPSSIPSTIVVMPSDDPTRLTVDTTRHGYSGVEVAQWLGERRIDVEMADERMFLAILSVMDPPEWLPALATALSALPQRTPFVPVLPPTMHAGERVCSLRDAMLGAQEPVPMEDAVERIAAMPAGRYPPGIAWVLPGERITSETVHALSTLSEHARFGIEQGCMICRKEC